MRVTRGKLAMLLAAAVAVAAPAAAGATPPPRPKHEAYLGAGLVALATRDHGEAADFLAQAGHPLALKLLQWARLARGSDEVTFAEVTAFMRDNPGWPYQNVLRRRVEDAAGQVPAADRLAWFDRHPPISTRGRVAYGDALLDLGRPEQAAEVLRQAWIEGTFTPIEERRFLARYKRFLDDDDHRARLDRLLWDRHTNSAQRMLMRVDRDHRLLAQARIALMSNSWGVDGAVRRVPAHLADDPGLVYERVRWRRRHNLKDTAIDLLLAHGGHGGEPARWWTERHVLARHALGEGKPEVAYRIVAAHGSEEGAAFAEAEWLAGWLALRFLDRPADARRHFERLHAGVSFPISRARGAYWSGRAAEAGGDADGARAWYARAGDHDRTFYGQLALARLGAERPPPFPPGPQPMPQQRAAFDARDVVRVARLLGSYGADGLTDIFIRHIGRTAATAEERVLAVRLARDVGRLDLAVSLARTFDLDGLSLIDANYPLPPLPLPAEEVEEALLLALIRQESGFRDNAVSRAGARGLMQVMPATAKQVARLIDLRYSPHRLTDPVYNLTLGSAYLARLLERFDGSYVLALAAYNAGPARAERWIRAYGDPRQPSVDAIDWIESLPFSETRNYIQRVLENVHVYRRRLDTVTTALPLEMHVN